MYVILLIILIIFHPKSLGCLPYLSSERMYTVNSPALFLVENTNVLSRKKFPLDLQD